MGELTDGPASCQLTEMARNVFIFGAGASKDIGAPIMRDFLDQARSVWSSLRSGPTSESFGRVFKALSGLQRVHSKAELDIHNIESVFTTFEMAKTLGYFPGDPDIDVDQLVNDLKTVIVSTLDHRTSYPLDDYRWEFVRHITDRKIVARRGSCAVLTFNYDLSLDLALMGQGMEIDYGLSHENPNALPLLKLHGSQNWTIKRGAGSEPALIEPLEIHVLSRHASPVTSGVRKVHSLTAVQSQTEQNGHDSIPFIVPPSWNKADSHRQISKVWGRASKELSEATSIFVIGYSLPDTDTFFRQLFALGTMGDQILERFWVFNPDKERRQHFLSMLGPGARERFRFFPNTFYDLIGALQNDWNADGL